MISEVVPAPKAYMFFALFNCVGKTSGFIGPFISSAIIKADGGRNNSAYWFLLGTGLIGLTILYFVDTDQAKIDSAACKFSFLTPETSIQAWNTNEHLQTWNARLLNSTLTSRGRRRSTTWMMTCTPETRSVFLKRSLLLMSRHSQGPYMDT
jgi:hypothetical protein